MERLTGVPVADLEATARALGTAGRAIILTARGAEQHAKGIDTVTALRSTSPSRSACPAAPAPGTAASPGRATARAAGSTGRRPTSCPATGRSTTRRPGRTWPGSGASTGRRAARPGRVRRTSCSTALGTPDGPRALLVFGSNPVVSAPRAARVEGRLRALDLLVVADFVLSETAALADVVLPTAQWAEEDGTMTNLEGRVLRRRALRPPPPGVRTDLAVIAELAAPAGRRTADVDRRRAVARPFPADPAAVFDELRRASAGGPADYAGISWDRIDADDGVFWPCPTADGPGTPRLFADRFATPDGRARFIAGRAPAGGRGGLTPTYPLYLTTGRVLAQYQSGAQTRRVGRAAPGRPGGVRRAAPGPGRPAGHRRRRRGTGGQPPGRDRRAPARVATRSDRTRVFAPFHWAGAGRANSVTNDALDPISRMPEFKVCAVRRGAGA